MIKILKGLFFPVIVFFVKFKPEKTTWYDYAAPMGLTVYFIVESIFSAIKQTYIVNPVLFSLVTPLVVLNAFVILVAWLLAIVLAGWANSSIEAKEKKYKPADKLAMHLTNAANVAAIGAIGYAIPKLFLSSSVANLHDVFELYKKQLNKVL